MIWHWWLLLELAILPWIVWDLRKTRPKCPTCKTRWWVKRGYWFYDVRLWRCLACEFAGRKEPKGDYFIATMEEAHRAERYLDEDKTPYVKRGPA